MTFLAVWEGRVTGSLGGRDDGYPETKTALVDTEEDLYNRFHGCKNLQVYTLTSVPSGKLSEIWERVIRTQDSRKKAVEKLKTAALSKLSSAERKVLGLN